MANTTAVTLKSGAGDVTVEVAVQYPHPAAITVAVYNENRQKERDVGSALSMEPPDPDEFGVSPNDEVPTLHKKLIGVFVSIGSFSGAPEESYVVVSSLRQGGSAVSGGLVVRPGVVKDGGAGVIIGYKTEVA